MARPFVSELREGDLLSGSFVAKDVSLRQFRDASKGYYLALNLVDRTGVLPARVWDAAESVAQGFQEGDVVSVEGRVEVYQDQYQAVLTEVHPVLEEQIDAADFLPATARDVDKMIGKIRQIVAEEVECPHLNALLRRFIDSEDITPLLAQAPAAKGLHHAYLGGLVEHILGCLCLARTAARLHRSLDRSLLLAGIVLHDIGKIKELSVSTTIDYSIPGRLIGHVVMGYEWVMREMDAIEGFPEETRLQLGHIILSHHGQHDYGAPVLPMTPEAIAVHFIENTDAQTNRYLSAVQAAREDDRDFTDFDRLLSRHLYARPRTEDTG